MTDMYLRTELVQPLPPPAEARGALGFLREKLFPNWWNSLLSIVGLAVAAYVAWVLVDWMILRAVWTGTSRDACVAVKDSGACWPFITNRIGQFIYGFYPEAERWRPTLFFVLGAALLVPLAIPSVPFKRLNAVLFLLVYPVVSVILLSGGVFGLPFVRTGLWGGFLVTIVVAITGIVASLPLGILLALGRRSKMPLVKLMSVIFIEFWRGVPLITVLFFAMYMLPLFIPREWQIDNLLRALIGVALFSAAYMAEVVRGGLQAIPKGQYEGAMAVGLGYWQMMGLIVLPQALKLVIPGIVNTFIGLFKDTTLVSIVAIYDLLNQIQSGFNDPRWATPNTAYTGFAFAGIIYFVFCYGMSRYSVFIERRLHRGHKR